LHVGEAIGDLTQEPYNYKKVGIIGSSFIMQQSYFRAYCLENFNIEIFPPDGA